MTEIYSALQLAVIQALHKLYQQQVSAEQVVFQETRKEFEGDITLVVFPYAKLAGKSPDAVGAEIGAYLKDNSAFINTYNVLKGFLNLEIKSEYWIKAALEIQHSGTQNLGNPKTVMVEYSSPNTNKPLHLGHIRNNLLGYSVAEIIKATGNKVIKANLVNDRGIHICKSMLAWQKFGNGESPESSGLKGDKLVGKYYVAFDKHYKEEIEVLVGQGLSKEEAEKQAPAIKEAQQLLVKWEAGDPEVLQLWSTMNGWVYKGFDETYKKLGVDFDHMYYESQTYLLGKKIVEEGLQKGVFYKKEDNSVWIDLSSEGLDHKLVQRGDGTSVYITQDIGTAEQRFEQYHMEQLIYVVGNEQDYHFKVLKLIMQKLGRPWAQGIFHLSYGMVDLPSGKMKSREGTVVDADDLIDEMINTAKETTEQLGKIDGLNADEAASLFNKIGMGALKYYILKVDPKKRMMFNPQESIDLNGNTGPFIQYTHARIKSVLQKTGVSVAQQNVQSVQAKEKELIKQLLKYQSALSEAAELLNPAIIAAYVYELAKVFNQFYHHHNINNEPEQIIRNFRIFLAENTANTIKKCLQLLGIEAPERM